MVQNWKKAILNHTYPIFGSPDLSGKGTYKFTYVRASVSSGPTALTVQYFFLIFCMKLGLHTTSMTTKKIFDQKKILTPKMAKNGQIWAKIDNFEHFWPIFPKRRYKFSWFLLWELVLRYSFRKSRCMVRENSEMAKIWPFVAKIWPFSAKKWHFWKFLTYHFQTLLWNLLIFGMETTLMVSFQKIIVYMPGKF